MNGNGYAFNILDCGDTHGTVTQSPMNYGYSNLDENSVEFHQPPQTPGPLTPFPDEYIQEQDQLKHGYKNPMVNSDELHHIWDEIMATDDNDALIHTSVNPHSVIPQSPVYTQTEYENNTYEAPSPVPLPISHQYTMLPIPIFGETVLPATATIATVQSNFSTSMPPPVSTRTRRKSAASAVMKNATILLDEEATFEVDIKPIITQATPSTRGRKRTSVNSFPDSPAPGSPSQPKRKQKKYELEDDSDPSVKNAKAAKTNRENKKKQFEEATRTIEKLSQELKEKDVKNEALTLALNNVTAELEILKQNDTSSQTLQTTQGDIQRYLKTTLPAIQTEYGLGYPTVFIVPGLSTAGFNFPGTNIQTIFNQDANTVVIGSSSFPPPPPPLPDSDSRSTPSSS